MRDLHRMVDAFRRGSRSNHYFPQAYPAAAFSEEPELNRINQRAIIFEWLSSQWRTRFLCASMNSFNGVLILKK